MLVFDVVHCLSTRGAKKEKTNSRVVLTIVGVRQTVASEGKHPWTPLHNSFAEGSEKNVIKCGVAAFLSASTGEKPARSPHTKVERCKGRGTGHQCRGVFYNLWWAEQSQKKNRSCGVPKPGMPAKQRALIRVQVVNTEANVKSQAVSIVRQILFALIVPASASP